MSVCGPPVCLCISLYLSFRHSSLDLGFHQSLFTTEKPVQTFPKRLPFTAHTQSVRKGNVFILSVNGGGAYHGAWDWTAGDPAPTRPGTG